MPRADDFMARGSEAKFIINILEEIQATQRDHGIKIDGVVRDASEAKLAAKDTNGKAAEALRKIEEERLAREKLASDLNGFGKRVNDVEKTVRNSENVYVIEEKSWKRKYLTWSTILKYALPVVGSVVVAFFAAVHFVH